jgi:nitrogen regulatory protein PII
VCARHHQLKKGELLDHVVKKAGVTKVMADKVLAALTDSIAESLADGKKGESRVFVDWIGLVKMGKGRVAGVRCRYGPPTDRLE